MNEENIIAKLRSELQIVKPKVSDAVEQDDNFRDVWGMDSLELVEFVARIEQSFRILIPDKDLRELYSLSSTAGYIQKRASGA